MNTSVITRQIVAVNGRKVHLRHAGTGPRLLGVHGSPASSEYFVPLLLDMAHEYCCIAPDTPGFGESDALPADQVSIEGLARATAELIETLHIGPCMVLGSHTGAGIALELAAQRPDLVSGLILDGVPMFTEAEQRELFDGYCEALQVDERGGHYARTWTRIRDMFIWFPWTSHDPARLNGTNLPPPSRAQNWVRMFFQAAPNYAAVYRAAIGYAQRALVAAAAQTRPTLYLAHERDMLAPHLQRLPALKKADRIECTSWLPGKWLAAVQRGVTELAQSNEVTRGALATSMLDAHDRFVDLHMDNVPSQIRLRRYGSLQAPFCLLLHDAPASGLSLQSLAQSLANDLCVWVPDLPGCGASTPLSSNAPSLIDYVQVLQALCTIFDNRPLHVYGRGCGAVLALMWAIHKPSSMRSLLFDELPLEGPGCKAPDARICPPLTLEADGSQWFRTWQMLRDSQIYWPWYETSAEHLLRLPGNFQAEFLHDWVLQVMQQPETAHCLPQAACHTDAASLLAQLTIPTTLMARAGHPLCTANQAALSRYAQLRVMSIEDDERAMAILRVISGG